MRRFGRGLIGALKKQQQQRLWIRRVSDLVVGQQELPELLVEKRALGHRNILESVRCWVGIRIEGCIVDPTTPGPEAGAAHLMGIGLGHDRGREPGNLARKWGSTPAGEASNG